MKIYELTYFISPDITAEEIKACSQKITDFIAREQGTIESMGEPLRKRMAYPIKGRSESYLVSVVFRLNPDKVSDLEKMIKPDVLRHMLVEKKTTRERPERIRKPKKAQVEETEKSKKAELKEIDKKIEEILSE